jgi:cation:H+ antiporter
LLFLIFIASSAATWIAGIVLTKTTDSLDTRFKIGDAMGGLILLGIAASLPEIAVVCSAAREGHTAVIIGNLIGGICIQTLVIVILDVAVKGERPLSYLAGSLMLFFETSFAIVIAALAVVGTFIPAQSRFHVNPFSVAIALAWGVGLFLLNKARKVPRFNTVATDAKPGRKHHERRAVEKHVFYAKRSTGYVLGVFLFVSAVTLVAGVFLERTGSAIAARLGINSGIFAATVIALVTSLPEISTGLESVWIGDHQLAIADIMGGNAFMLVLFLIADLLMRKPVLSSAGHSDLLFGLLGIAMMGVYAATFLVKLRRRYFRLGLDSLLQMLLYAAGIVALMYVK